MDYEGIFDPEENTRSGDGLLQYTIPANVMFVLFVGIVTIAMMNLLMGLAVSDIQELIKSAELHRVTNLIEQLRFFESTICHNTLVPPFLRSWARNHTSITPLLDEREENPSRRSGSTSSIQFEPNETDSSKAPLPRNIREKFLHYLDNNFCVRELQLRELQCLSGNQLETFDRRNIELDDIMEFLVKMEKRNAGVEKELKALREIIQKSGEKIVN